MPEEEHQREEYLHVRFTFDPPTRPLLRVLMLEAADPKALSSSRIEGPCS